MPAYNAKSQETEPKDLLEQGDIALIALYGLRESNMQPINNLWCQSELIISDTIRGTVTIPNQKNNINRPQILLKCGDEYLEFYLGDNGKYLISFKGLNGCFTKLEKNLTHLFQSFEEWRTDDKKNMSQNFYVHFYSPLMKWRSQ